LILQRGKWEDQIVVSETWLNESTTTRTNLSMSRGYGYYWNEMRTKVDGVNTKAIFAPGDGGQFISVFPSLNMVIVFTAGDYNSDPASKYWNIINSEILPAVTSHDLK
jgi:CubicO group peptidase (beta-lactamase class C family)